MIGNRDYTPIQKPGRRARKICVLAFTDYEADGRVLRYARTLAKRGDSVDVIGYAREDGQLQNKVVEGVNLYKIQRWRETGKGANSHLLPLLEFFFRSFWFITRKHFRKSYDLIHVHNIPEWLVFAAIIPKMLGARIILDIHDIVPELYANKFSQGSKSAAIDYLLKQVEKASCSFSNHVIISNHLWQKKLVKRSVPASKCSAYINNIDPDIFYKRDRIRRDDRLIVLFHGTPQWHQGVDIAIKAFPNVLKNLPNAEFHIYGQRGVRKELEELTAELGLTQKVLFFNEVPIKEIPQIIANADLGVVPKRSDSFGNEAYSTKIMEFMSQGIPVIISRTAIDNYYFSDSEVRFFESGNEGELAEAMIEVLNNGELRQRMIQNSLEYVSLNDWGSRKQDFLSLVDQLIDGPTTIKRDLLSAAPKVRP